MSSKTDPPFCNHTHNESSCHSTCLSAFVVVSLLDFSPYSRWVVLSHCLIFQFPIYIEYLFIVQSYFLFVCLCWHICLNILPILNWVQFLLLNFKVSLCSLVHLLQRCFAKIFYKYNFYFYYFNSVFCRVPEKYSYLNEVQFTSFFNKSCFSCFV